MTVARSGHAVVYEIFAGTGAIYDRLVDVATQGEDRRWKEALLSALGEPRRVLDLACGTGILTFLLRARFPHSAIVGVDLQEEFLAVARQRAAEGRDERTTFVSGTAEDAPVEGGFDTVVSCYLPKYADLPRLVPRLAEWLDGGGNLAMQDFTYPRQPAVRAVWEGRFARLAAWSRESCPEACRMFEVLPEVIRSSRWTEELPDELSRHGFRDVRLQSLSLGSAAIVTARGGR